MDRRSFLALASLAVAAKAAERVWPFRVYSIPKKIEVYDATLLAQMNIDMEMAWNNVGVTINGNTWLDDWDFEFRTTVPYPKAISRQSIDTALLRHDLPVLNDDRHSI